MPEYQPADLQHSKAAIRRRTSAEGPSADRGPQPHALLRLQDKVGNAQVARLLAQRQEMPEEEELQTKRDPALLQRQEYPEEEELQTKRDPALLQRQAPDEEEEEELLQTKRDPSLLQREAEPVVGLEGGPVGDDLARQIDSKRGSGAGLPDSTRTQMEGAFGVDFGGVKVHQDGESDTLARSMTAKAFTTGSDIFLRQDVNAGDTSLMAHELTHVVQQSTGAAGGSGAMTVGAADDQHETDADQVAQAVASGAGAQRRIEDAHAR